MGGGEPVKRCRHTSGILDALLDPVAILSAGQHRHLLTCEVCGEAARRALALEDALARELPALRAEPLPRTVLATPPHERRSRLPSFLAPTRGIVLGVATVALAAVVTVGAFEVLDLSLPAGPATDVGSSPVAEATEGLLTGPGGAPPIADGAHAAARVLATDPLFAGLTVYPVAADGASPIQSTYEAAGDEFAVTMRVGWGDCGPDDCTLRHSWRYRVDAAGTVQLVEQAGDPLDAGDGYQASLVEAGDGELVGRTCASWENAPDCPGVWLAAAEVVVREPSGVEVSRAASAPFSGRFSLTAAAGVYVVEPLAVDGFEPPSPIAASLIGGSATEISVAYASPEPPAPGPRAEVVTDDLVVRSLPFVGADSQIFGELGPGTAVHVTDGPAVGSGYEWYRVEPAGETDFEPGWVAAASKETPAETWLQLPETPFLPGAECQPVRPATLPGGGPAGDVSLQWREATWFARWGTDADAVQQSVGSYGLPDVEQATFVPAQVRGEPARVVPADGGRLTVSWRAGDCRYTIWVGPGLTVEEVVEYAERY
jgi:hypothetical protein